MFAPAGFLMVSDLMDELADASSARVEMLSGIINSTSSLEDEKRDAFLTHRAYLANTLNLQEAELIAFETAIDGIAVFTCHPEKGIWQFRFPVFARRVRYRTLLNYTPDGADALYEVDRDWHAHHQRVAQCIIEHRDPWDETFLSRAHMSPNLFFARTFGLLDYSATRSLDRLLTYGFSLDSYGYPFRLSDIEPFEGWALCVEASGFDWGKFRSKFIEALVELVFSAAVGDDLVQSFKSDSPKEWTSFLFGNSANAAASVNATIASETRALNHLRSYVAAHGLTFTKAELRDACPEQLTARGFERVWARLREEHPELARPGRRGK
ncbi:hypothetical protein P2H44_10760 [Albimonas sp. CAU 1670]|uniref:hypothetical protein n=1 Tax=Albimonas sp. CAU 1670 TaxID=3032599 RepID=UPI0023D9B826|nr:hypothetical protein [Albimonas sp. CAU 1670]MDF2233033.1 hypothetical protein [Albimonas sp. CAU 1670]